MRITIGTTLLTCLLMVACNRPPEACIEVDNASTTVGSPVQLSSNCSKRALSYIWRFSGPTGAPENDSLRSEQVINFSFSVPGTYVVTLEAYERFSWVGQMGSAETSITVN